MRAKQQQQQEHESDEEAEIEALVPNSNGTNVEQRGPIARRILGLLAVTFIGTFSVFSEAAKTFLVDSSNTNVAKKKKSNHTRHHHDNTNDSLAHLSSIPPFDMTKYKTLYFYHLRKAGGTTLRIYMEMIAEHHNLTLEVDEGYCHQTKRYNTLDPNTTLRVTMLKDPVDRIVSEYWGEGNVNVSDPDSFRHYIVDGNETSNDPTITPHKFVWRCTFACLTKWFGGGIAPINMTQAQNALMNDYDLIVQSHRLGDSHYTAWLSHVLGAPEVEMPFKGASTKNLQRENQVAAPQEADLELLRHSNQLDYDLLEYLESRRPDLEGLLETKKKKSGGHHW